LRPRTGELQHLSLVPFVSSLWWQLWRVATYRSVMIARPDERDLLLGTGGIAVADPASSMCPNTHCRL
jgi:hypothetical protein